VNTDFSAGLQVSLLGLMITFVALGVFILIIFLLKSLFPAETAPKEDGTRKPAEIASETVVDEDLGEVVAAIAVALDHARIGPGSRSTSLGQSLQEGRGSWWAARRSEAGEGSVKQR